MGSAHRLEDLGIYVLNGNVEIVGDFVAAGNRFDELFVDSGGVEIEQANPFEARDFGKLAEQAGEGEFGFEVSAVGGYVLSDYVQFDGAGGNKLLGLGEDE
jgi:hypothetical protein